MKKYQQFIEDFQQRRADLKNSQEVYGQEYNERIREIELKLANAEENA